MPDTFAERRQRLAQIAKAQGRGAIALVPGAKFSHISGLHFHLVHKTGHGLGLDIHEAPQIMKGNPKRLIAGTVFTIEPGLYRPGDIGVRIEDNVVTLDSGARSLTSFPRELTIVGV